MQVDIITDAPMAGMYQVMTNRGLFYVSHDATYFIHGRVFNLDEGMRNETEEAGNVHVDGINPSKTI